MRCKCIAGSSHLGLTQFHPFILCPLAQGTTVTAAGAKTLCSEVTRATWWVRGSGIHYCISQELITISSRSSHLMGGRRPAISTSAGKWGTVVSHGCGLDEATLLHPRSFQNSNHLPWLYDLVSLERLLGYTALEVIPSWDAPLSLPLRVQPEAQDSDSVCSPGSQSPSQC